MEKHELKERLQLLHENVKKAQEDLQLENKTSEMKALEADMASAGFWDDQEAANAVVMEFKTVKNIVETWTSIVENTEGLVAMFEDLDASDYATFMEEITEVEEAYDKASLTLFFKGRYDKDNAMVTIKAGAGGDDAEDFGGMLLRMYTMYFDQKGFSYDIHEYNEGAGSNGIKKVELEVRGSYAYGLLKGEKGVHRLVRLSPFKSSDSRQTSFVHVDVMPLFRDVSKSEVEIKEEDLNIDTFRAQGAGGQKVNKTDSAVRITHVPSGIVVSCQVERSQHANKERAMQVLRAKLFTRLLEERMKEQKELQGDVVTVDWGKQIRSYVLHPYKMVKDHRTDVEVSHVDKVLDGDIEPFIEAELRLLAKDHS